MVSLDLLLGSPPATPREGPLQAVDPADPLMQQLVQDKSFLQAVQTSQLHAAATAAVRLLRAHLAATSSEFKRPPDRRASVPHANALPSDAPEPAPMPRPPGRPPGAAGAAGGGLVVHRQLVEPRHREAMRCMRLEVLGLEDVIPWDSVRRAWKTRRTTWRRQVKQTEVLSEFALRLKELRAALLTDEQPLPGCGSTWRAQLEVCIQGKGSYGLLAAAWEELRSTVRNWLEGRNKPAAVSAAALQAGAVRAVRAMQAALGGGAGGDADSALLQVPLESIVGHDSGAGLGAVRHAIELEQRILEKRLAGASSGISPAAPASSQQQPSEGGGAAADATPGQAPMLASAHGQSPLVSHFSSISAAWADSDFDSGASDRMDATSEGTDLDSDWDP
ncbi:hypothetical protein ABPG77_002896 [Micractinium sp. CCAP 211/92]